MTDAFGVSKGIRLPDGSRVRMISENKTFMGQPLRRVWAKRKGERIGLLRVADKGEIGNVAVDEPYRRAGVGRDMLKTAKRRGWNPQHSAQRTELGDAWARSVGGKVPDTRPMTSHRVDQI